MDEEWRPVVGFEQRYEVSNIGRLRNAKNKYVLKLPINCFGYHSYVLRDGSKVKNTGVHRMVAFAFLGPPPKGCQVNHKDGVRTNNVVANLEWVTASQNVLHSLYVLKARIHPVRAICKKTGAVRDFQSIELAAKEGFRSGHIYRALNKPNLSHGGYRWTSLKRPDYRMTIKRRSHQP